jgi:hypothetical protein
MDGDSAKDVGRQKRATANRSQLIVCRGHALADGAPYRYVMYA